MSLAGIEHQMYRRPAQSLITIPTELSRLGSSACYKYEDEGNVDRLRTTRSYHWFARFEVFLGLVEL